MARIRRIPTLIGRSIPRREDERRLRGAGRFLEDIRLDGRLAAVGRRSDHAHARLRAVDIDDAPQMPGVIAVFTGTDLQTAGIRPLPCVRPIESVDGRPFAPPPRHALAIEEVNHVGDPVALVVAETLSQATDAAETILIDYDPLPAAVDPEAKEKVAFVWEKGDGAKVAEILAAAPHVVECKVINNRIFMAPLEPRGPSASMIPWRRTICSIRRVRARS